MAINILYPAAIDSNASIPIAIDNVTLDRAEVTNRLRAAILAVEQAVGVNPGGIYGSVAARFNYLEALINSGGGGNSGITLGGDLSGTNTSQTVVGLFNHPIASTAPVQSAVPIWDSSRYDIRKLTLDDLGPAFAITSFSGGSIVEIGATVTNPTFTASYSSSPSSANITNTDNVDSPLVLAFPFTSGTVIGSFHHTSQTSVTFTLTADGATTKTATQAIMYLPRMFAGSGSAGATSATASGTNATLVGASGTLGNEGLSGNPVGTIYTLTPTGSQKFYLLLIGGSHTFKDSSTGFAFPFNAPTAVSFTNINGAVVSMYLYESSFLQSSTFNILVAS